MPCPSLTEVTHTWTAISLLFPIGHVPLFWDCPCDLVSFFALQLSYTVSVSKSGLVFYPNFEATRLKLLKTGPRPVQNNFYGD